MTTEVATTPVPRPAPPAGRWDRVAAWVLLTTLLVLLVGTVLLGERDSTAAQLRLGIGSGDITEVRLTEQLRPGSRGTASVQVRWERHGITHVTDVVQASSERVARRARRHGGGFVVVGDVAEALTSHGRTVTVVGGPVPYGGSYSEVLGFRAPTWIGLANLVVFFATLGLLVGSREPWRATRWAWAWLILQTPFGVPAFLVLGGLTGLIPPRPGAPRLTGGWAFILAVILNAAMD